MVLESGRHQQVLKLLWQLEEVSTHLDREFLCGFVNVELLRRPSSLPDLTTCVFSMWGMIEDKPKDNKPIPVPKMIYAHIKLGAVI
jgi:hypothetical protein